MHVGLKKSGGSTNFSTVAPRLGSGAVAFGDTVDAADGVGDETFPGVVSEGALEATDVIEGLVEEVDFLEIGVSSGDGISLANPAVAVWNGERRT